MAACAFILLTIITAAAAFTAHSAYRNARIVDTDYARRRTYYALDAMGEHFRADLETRLATDETLSVLDAIQAEYPGVVIENALDGGDSVTTVSVQFSAGGTTLQVIIAILPYVQENGQHCRIEAWRTV